ncbi:type II methionyl aminopeptidase [Candidatus Woesearchaeota archaeon]|nr:type II methionyl aminopeptidase [Candidatus Woesearchaeota archaeon]
MNLDNAGFLNIVDLEVAKPKLLRAGSIGFQALKFAKSLVKVGVKASDLINKVEEFILKQGVSLAFPVQVSVNNIAAHFYASKFEGVDHEFALGDVVKIDLGVCVDGFLSDTASTVVIENQEGFELKKASENALRTALKMAKPGTLVSEIGEAISSEIESLGFKPVKNLSGHGLGLFNVHTSPSIPNYNNKSQLVLQENMVIAIEPFSTNGVGLVKEQGSAQVFIINPAVNAFLRTSQARKVFEFAKTFKGLPFAKPWFYNKFSRVEIAIGFQELIAKQVFYGFPPLVEVGNGLVAQEEHTVIVRESPIVTTKLDD